MKQEHYFTSKPTGKIKNYEIDAVINDNEFTFKSASGVFSATRIDKGSFLLALNIPKLKKKDAKILDFGCGYGFLGIVAAKLNPKAKVFLTDINERATNLAEKNIKLNKIKNAVVHTGNMLEPFVEIQFDLILLNPPQTAGKDICHTMICGAYNELNKNGKLLMVVRKNKGGTALHDHMKKHFDKTTVIAKKGGYWVYEGTKTRS